MNNQTLILRFSALKKALIEEREIELKTYRLLLEERSMKERVEEGVTIYPLDFQESIYDKFGALILVFKIPKNSSSKYFGSSGKCILFSGIVNEKESGVIASNKGDVLKVMLPSGEIPEWIKSGKLGLDAVCDTRTYDVQIETLDKLVDLKEGIAHDFYKNNKPDFPVITVQNNQLNDSQNKALSALLTDAPVHIIHGPPGTGKTKTLVAAVGELLKRNLRILIATPTNAAADHIAFEIHTSGISVLRYGNSFKMSEKVETLSLDYKTLHHQQMDVVNRLTKEAESVRKKAFRFIRNFGQQEQQERKALKAELRSLRDEIRKLEQRIESGLIETHSVVCGTLIGLLQPEILRTKFDVLIVDEAAQAMEPAIWSLAQHVSKLIVAGDPFQLPPVLFSVNAEKSPLAVSLIEKAMELGYTTHLLDTQYRMNDKIMQFSNSNFYKNQLKSDPDVGMKKIPNDSFEPIEFIDTAGCSFEENKDDQGGIYNEKEADLLVKRFEEIILSNKQIGIIAPYRKQVLLLQEKLITYPDIVQTIDSIQGQEREVIMISLTRSNVEHEIGFLKDYRRMNVAMTRAKIKLILVGDSATLGIDAFYADLLDYVEHNGTYRSAWEYAL